MIRRYMVSYLRAQVSQAKSASARLLRSGLVACLAGERHPRSSKIFWEARRGPSAPDGCSLALKARRRRKGSRCEGAAAPPINRGAVSVDAAVFASALCIAVAPHAELILPDVGAAVGLPLLVAGVRFGKFLLSGRVGSLRLPMLPPGDTGQRPAVMDAIHRACAVGCCRRCGDRRRERRREPGQGNPCLQHCSSPRDPSTRTGVPKRCAGGGPLVRSNLVARPMPARVVPSWDGNDSGG